MQDLFLQPSHSLTVAGALSYSEERGISVPWPGAEPASPALKAGFLTAGPPGKSRLNGIPLHVYITSSLSICWRHLPCFHIFAVVNNASVNMGVQVFLEDPNLNSFGYLLGSGAAESYG